MLETDRDWNRDQGRAIGSENTLSLTPVREDYCTPEMRMSGESVNISSTTYISIPDLHAGISSSLFRSDFKSEYHVFGIRGPNSTYTVYFTCKVGT